MSIHRGFAEIEAWSFEKICEDKKWTFLTIRIIFILIF